MMSNTYEFENTLWNKFCDDNGDHIVPEQGRGQANNQFILSDSLNYKKPLHENICITGNKSWSIETSSFDNARLSSHGFNSNQTDSNGSVFCKDDASLTDKTAASNNSFSYSLGEVTCAKSNQNFGENTDYKDLNDLLYNDWPEMGNFEDVDEMFRDCDSTFGFGISGEDESGRLSHAYNIGCNFNDDEVAGLVFPSESNPLNVQEMTNVSSGAGDISPEASSIRQLQLVMEQLDLKMKTCIKDSLYRLAQSAEQRHKHVNLNDDESDTNEAPMAERKNEYTSLMDVETDSNPVDRSMAHLLFYTPAEFYAVHA